MPPQAPGADPIDYQRLFRSGSAPVLLLDPDLVILDVSDAYLRATMTARDTLVGAHLFDAFPDNPDDPDADGVANLRSSLERVRRDLTPDTMAVQKYDIPVPESDGGGFDVRWWSPVNTPVLGARGELRWIIHRVEDVTEYVRLRQHAAEHVERTDELEERTTRLEAEFYLRSQELQAANRRLVELDRVRSAFLSRMSHELRTPLNAVLGFAQVLDYDELSDDQRESVHQILRGGRHLLGLIDDVLDIARVDAGRLNLSVEDVSVRDAVDAAVELVEGRAQALGVRVTSDGVRDEHVVADRQRLVQVLLNLLSNAVKYNRPNGRVDVFTEASGDTHLRVAVRDTGAGIAPAGLDRIFEPFERLGAETTDIEGAGVGLAVAKGLADRMGGTLAVESIVGAGSTFSIELLRATEPVARFPAVAVPVGVHGEARPITVVYVEDNLANLRLIEQVMRLRGSTTLHACLLYTSPSPRD